MDARTWPLSAAATQLLLDARADRRPTTTESTLAQLAVKELLLRGGLRIDEVMRRAKKEQIVVTHQRLGGQAPPAVALMATKLQRAKQQPLGPLMKSTFRANRDLPRRIRTSAEEELVTRGLLEHSSRRVLGLFPSKFLALTATGQLWQQRAQAVISRGDELAGRGTPPTPAEVDSLGPLLVLVPGGLSLGARTAAALRRDPARRSTAVDDELASRSRRDAERRHDPVVGSDGSSFSPVNAAFLGGAAGAAIGTESAAAAEERREDEVVPSGAPLVPDGASLDGGADGDGSAGAEPFLPLDGLGNALGGFLDDALSGIGSAIDSIDGAVDAIGGSIESAMDSIDSAMGSIDSAIDSGVSDGAVGGGFDGGGGGGDGGGA